MTNKKNNIEIASNEKIVGNTFLSSISEMSLLFMSVFFILAARYLGDEAYGKLGVAINLSGIFSLLIIFGFYFSITKFIVKQRDKAGSLIGNALYVQLFFALVSAVGLFGYIYFLRERYPTELQIVIVIVFVSEILRCMNFTLRAAVKALGKFKYDTLAFNIERIILLVGGGYLLIQGKDLFTVVFIFPVSRLASFSILIFLLERHGQNVFIKPDLKICRELISKSWEYVVQNIFWMVYDYLDVFMIQLLRSFAEVGWYTVARKILESLWMIPNIVTEAVYPELSARHLVSHDLVQDLFDRSFKYIFIVSIAVSLGTVVIAPWLIRTLFGPDYENSIIVLVLLGIAVIPSFLRYLFGTTLIAMNSQRQLIYIEASRSGANILLNFSLIPFYGYIGATVATVLTEYISLIVFYVVLKKHQLLHRSQLSFVLKSLLAGVLSAGIFLMLNHLFPVALFFIILVTYGLLIICFKVIEKKEILFLKGYISQYIPFIR